jgi:CubicO group peptidase (beta-lactamase class C family)
MKTDASAAGFSEGRLNRVNDHLQGNYIDTGRIHGCQILVARKGCPALFQSYGLKEAERSLAIADDTIFRIYSMTKPITSIALMQLYERGLFQLNDPVHRVIPEWRDHRVYVSGEGASMKTEAVKAPMTFRHVLSHCSGLTYGNSPHPVDQEYQRLGVRRSDGETLNSFVQKLAGVPLRYQPGEKWLYSLATDVCGYLVEALSGLPFDEYLQKYIFDPLDMADTAFQVAPEKLDRFAANYQRRKDKTLKLIDAPEHSAYRHKPDFVSGGGGLTGTTRDYYRFCEMLRGGGQLDGVRIIGSRTLNLMTQNHLPRGYDLTEMAMGSFSETAYEGVGFGLGFAMTLGKVESGQVASGDYYWGGAASTIFWVDPLEEITVVFMTQLMPSATFNFRGQLKNIIYGAIED